MQVIQLLLAAALLQQTPDEIIKALSDSSAVARGEAAEKLAAGGRKAIPLLRETEAKASGDVRDEVRKIIARIGDVEVRELLKAEGHADLSDIKVYTDEALTKILPQASVYLLPGKPDCKACGNVERHAVVNVLADEKGAPVRVKDAAAVAKLFKVEAKTDESRRAVAAAAMYVLRAIHPKAHTSDVVPKDESYADPSKFKAAKRDNDVQRITADLKIGHAYWIAHADFDAKGSLAGITLEDTGKRCR